MPPSFLNFSVGDDKEELYNTVVDEELYNTAVDPACPKNIDFADAVDKEIYFYV